MGSCFSRKSKQIKSKGTDSQLESQVVNCYENLETSLSPCYNGLGIYVALIDSNGKPFNEPNDCIYHIFYRNETRREMKWCSVDGNCILKINQLAGRYCLLQNLIGGDTYQVKTELVLNNQTGSISISSETSTEIPLKSHLFSICKNFC